MNPLQPPRHPDKLKYGDWFPLEHGDELTREEFERRYERMPRVKKAELIDGIVYMPSPVRLYRHGRPHAHLAAWLATYESETPGVVVGDNATARLDEASEPQPDLLLMISPECGGQARIDSDDYVESAPELVAEIASSSVSYDLHAKLDSYQRNAVQEYIVWRVLNNEVDWFVLQDGRYEQLAPDANGFLQSRVFPGLWLDAAALVQGDLARVLAVVQQGLASPPHAEFVARLRKARK